MEPKLKDDLSSQEMTFDGLYSQYDFALHSKYSFRHEQPEKYLKTFGKLLDRIYCLKKADTS